MTAPTELALHVYSISCACGHQWTHSSLLLTGQGLLGGTPTALQEANLPVTKYLVSTRSTHHCFRCVEVSTIKPVG